MDWPMYVIAVDAEKLECRVQIEVAVQYSNEQPLPAIGDWISLPVADPAPNWVFEQRNKGRWEVVKVRTLEADVGSSYALTVQSGVMSWMEPVWDANCAPSVRDQSEDTDNESE